MFSISSLQQKVKKHIQATQASKVSQPLASRLGGIVAKASFQGSATSCAKAAQHDGSTT
jgi:hypothetical protein